MDTVTVRGDNAFTGAPEDRAIDTASGDCRLCPPERCEDLGD